MYATAPRNAIAEHDLAFDADGAPPPLGLLEADLDPDFDLDFLDPAFTDEDEERLSLFWIGGPIGGDGSPLIWHLARYASEDADETECGRRASAPALVIGSDRLAAHALKCSRCCHLAARYLDDVTKWDLESVPDTIHCVGDDLL